MNERLPTGALFLMLNAIIVNPKSSMHKLMHTLATCMLLLHALGGCCWHHDHDMCLGCSEDSVSPIVTSGGTNAEGDCEFCQCQTECDEDECAFVTSRLRSVVKAVGGSCPSAGVCAQVFVTPSAMRARHALCGPLHSSSPPLRLHLLNQVLLA